MVALQGTIHQLTPCTFSYLSEGTSQVITVTLKKNLIDLKVEILCASTAEPFCVGWDTLGPCSAQLPSLQSEYPPNKKEMPITHHHLTFPFSLISNSILLKLFCDCTMFKLNYGNETDALSWMWNVYYMSVKLVAHQKKKNINCKCSITVHWVIRYDIKTIKCT